MPYLQMDPLPIPDELIEELTQARWDALTVRLYGNADVEPWADVKEWSKNLWREETRQQIESMWPVISKHMVTFARHYADVCADFRDGIRDETFEQERLGKWHIEEDRHESITVPRPDPAGAMEPGVHDFDQPYFGKTCDLAPLVSGVVVTRRGSTCYHTGGLWHGFEEYAEAAQQPQEHSEHPERTET